ncbi:MAG: hypothetical protein FJZ59_05475 [Chlamydiae bacterium]|nr:hypothetical protein [Chlamydiota bacterium]
MSASLRPTTPIARPEPIDLIKIWLESVESVTKNGAKENLARFHQLIRSFPTESATDESKIILDKLVEMIDFSKTYSPTLKKATKTALEKFNFHK